MSDIGANEVAELRIRFEAWLKAEGNAEKPSALQYAAWVGYQAGAGALADHLAAETKFLNQLYVNLVDPDAKGTMTVEAMQEAILKASRSE